MRIARRVTQQGEPLTLIYATDAQDDRMALSEWNPHLIYVEGGNTFWLQHCIEKGNYSALITEACTGPNGSVYCGKSAGAIVAGKSIETATWKGWDDPSVVPGRERYDQWIGCMGFGFVGDQSFFPHYGSEWADLVKEKTASGSMSDTICLREEDVCCIVGELGSRIVLGSEFNP
jgi:peptidase E